VAASDVLNFNQYFFQNQILSFSKPRWGKNPMAIKLPTPDGKFKPLNNPGIELGCKGFKK
jgi:hypothetical protein